jgi:pyridoxamine 5'-phosphate oxidase
MTEDRLKTMRTDYEAAGIDPADLLDDPFEQFQAWFDDALHSGLPEPHAMVLATAGPDGAPTARAVLLRELDPAGFVFFTNYSSQKGNQLASNPLAAGCFLWLPLHRQVRVEGRVEQISPEESDAYFSTRPRESQIGAHASPQSEVIPDRRWLEDRVIELAARFGTDEIPRPPNWGGYRLIPDRIEFWQGRPNRLHDRVLFARQGSGWTVRRLAP